VTAALPPLSRPDQCVVIVGAGLAGVRTAEGLRGAEFRGRVVLVGDEPHAPYDRPPLSKAVLRKVGQEHEIKLLPAEELQGLDIELRLGRAAVAINRDSRILTLSDGEQIGYDRLVLATGSSARSLPQLPPGAARVHYLRGLDDALALRGALDGARRVAIIGAGVIGLEVAAAAVNPHRAVTVIEAADRVMGRAASPPVARFIAEQHAQAGVDVRLSTTVVRVDDDGESLVLTLSDGQMLACDLVVVGVGVKPNDALARASGLEVQPGGVVVDGHGMSSDPAVYAAGEVAVHFNTLHGRHDRQETWAHAAAHGEHVGRALVLPGAAYEELASYWTDQYDFTLNVLGAPIGEVDVMRGQPADGKFVVFHLIGGMVAGVSALNAMRDLRAARGLIGTAVDPVLLGDPASDLRALV